MPQNPWDDKTQLYDKYWGEGKSQSQMAEEWGVSQALISNRLASHSIPTRGATSPQKYAEAMRWSSYSHLYDQYVVQRKSSREIADECGFDKSTVQSWLDGHGIDLRERREAHQLAMWANPACLYTREDGYEVWETQYNGEKSRLFVHRLLAVAEYGFDAVVDKEVHHKSQIPWDNRPENIEPLSPAEHRRLHNLNRADGQRETIRRQRGEGALAGGDAA